MVDFTREHLIDVEGVCQRFNVCAVTVHRWFRRGLEWVKTGGKFYTSLEALNRFSRQSDTVQPTTQINCDRETAQAIRELRDRFGFITAKDARTNGHHTQTAGAA